VAENATTARDAVSERPDVALVDLVLHGTRFGGRSGIDLVTEIRAQSPETFIVIISAMLSNQSAFEAGRAAADMVAMKPFGCEDLIQRIELGGVSACDDVRYTLAKLEYEHIMRTLQETNGNRTRAAWRLGIPRQSLQRRLRRHAPRV